MFFGSKLLKCSLLSTLAFLGERVHIGMNSFVDYLFLYNYKSVVSRLKVRVYVQPGRNIMASS